MDETADAMRSVVLRDKDRFKMTEPFRGPPASYTSGSSSTPLTVHLERALSGLDDDPIPLGNPEFVR
jgi:hypothetical protein